MFVRFVVVIAHVQLDHIVQVIVHVHVHSTTARPDSVAC